MLRVVDARLELVVVEIGQVEEDVVARAAEEVEVLREVDFEALLDADVKFLGAVNVDDLGGWDTTVSYDDEKRKY